MPFWNNKKDEQPKEQPVYEEGDIVAHQEDTFRVRRNYGDSLQLVNNTTHVYPVVPTTQVESTYFCGHCSAYVAISSGLHPHGN